MDIRYSRFYSVDIVDAVNRKASRHRVVHTACCILLTLCPIRLARERQRQAITRQAGALPYPNALSLLGFKRLAKARAHPSGGPGDLRPECRKGHSKNCTLFSLPGRFGGFLPWPWPPMGQPKTQMPLFFSQFRLRGLAPKVQNRPQTATGGRIFLVIPGFGHKKTPGAADERAPGAVWRGETESPDNHWSLAAH